MLDHQLIITSPWYPLQYISISNTSLITTNIIFGESAFNRMIINISSEYIYLKRAHIKWYWLEFPPQNNQQTIQPQLSSESKIRSSSTVIRKKNNYSIKHVCPYYKLKVATPHDHFLTCNESESSKDRWIAKIKACLTLLDTPNTMIAIIIRRLNTFYNNSIQHLLNKLSLTLLNI